MSLTARQRSALDSAFTKICGDISAKQPTFRTQKGRYWQGIEIDAQNPDLTAKPEDQEEDWTGFPFTKTQGKLAVDVYKGPQGEGYVVRMQVDVNGTTYQKLQDFGTDGRSTGWLPLLIR